MAKKFISKQLKLKEKNMNQLAQTYKAFQIGQMQTNMVLKAIKTEIHHRAKVGKHGSRSWETDNWEIDFWISSRKGLASIEQFIEAFGEAKLKKLKLLKNTKIHNLSIEPRKRK